ncbi:MAG: Gldg family protein [Bacteroidetes bacterium]|nr:Gldg family protein [Bacteroidota bacterium]MDA1121730.1 Gldg family protein [Bacteroidota bacterium]
MKKNVFIQIVILSAILLVINLISNQLYFRLDFTADQRYTLSDATKNVLKDIDDVVSVKAYFSEDLPPQLLGNRQDFLDLLIEYENRSNGNLVYEFINPNEDEESESVAQQKGISPVVINVTERDQVQQMRAYMGAVIEMGDRTEIIPVIQPGAAMEYDLTTVIKKISIEDKPKLAILQGHGEPTINAIVQLVQQLSVLYDVEPYTITGTEEIPSFYKALAIIEPSDTINTAQLNRIDNYINSGGNVFVAFTPMKGDLQSAFLQRSPDIGLRAWLSSKGIQLGDNFIVDAECASVSVRQRLGPFGMVNTQIQFPYFPIIKEFADHPVSKGLESLMLPFATTISANRNDSTLRLIPLAMSSDNSGLVPPGGMIDINKKWSESDFPLQNETLAAAFEGRLGSNSNAKMVLVTNGTYAVNGEPEAGQQQQVNPDNISFTSNAIDWLSDDTGLIDLRTKGITSRPLDQIEDATRNLIKYGNVFAPILLILIYAFIRKQANARKKQNWMQGNY